MQEHGISKLDLKRQNRMQVLKILKQQGPTSRIDIAKMLKLTRAAVTIITNEMISQGIIVEVGEYQRTTEKVQRGRKKILIDINQNYKFVLGVLIDETMISVGLSTLVGAVLDKRNIDIDIKSTYEDIVKFIKDSISGILQDNCLSIDNILGIGIGIFPSMYQNAGVEFSVEKGADFTKIAVDVYDNFKVPIILDNSVKGMAMANIDFQATKDLNRHNIAFLRYSDSLHFVVTNLNEPIVSYDNRTDFADKIIVNPFATVDREYGNLGSAKAEVSAVAYILKFKEIYSETNTPILYQVTNGDINAVEFDTIRKAIEASDENVVKLHNEIMKLFAILINNLYYSTNPQKIVIHNINANMLADLKKAVTEVSGEKIAELIDVSIIEKKHGFLSGAAIAIRQLFFIRGGFESIANNADED